jgi:hypothetical protein
MPRLDWDALGTTAAALAVAVVGSYFGQPLIHGNDTAINVIVTVFSILAGFLIAIIAIIGDPLLVPAGTWRIAEGARKKSVQRLTRHKYLFHVYLMSLALVFFSVLLKDNYPRLGVWIERAYLFLSVFAFVVSLRLPAALMQMQQERVDHLIDERRKKRGGPAARNG